jgi:DNA-binding MarR family transcriptional regulator
VQFQLLARLGDAPGGQLRMTDLADSVVYSRSGLTYQAGQLDRAGLVTRTGGQDDERCVVVTITAAGRALVARVLPGHVEVVQQLLFLPLNSRDVAILCRVLTRIRDHMRAAPPRSDDTRNSGGRSG